MAVVLRLCFLFLCLNSAFSLTNGNIHRTIPFALSLVQIAVGGQELPEDSEQFGNFNVLFSDENEDLRAFPSISYGCPANNSRACVPKCCMVNETMTEDNCAFTEEDLFFPVFADRSFEDLALVSKEDRFEYFIGNPCTSGRYLLEPENNTDDEYLLYSNGTLSYAGALLSMSDFCVDTLYSKIGVFVCFDIAPEPTLAIQHVLYPIGLILSIPFLLATAAVYLGCDGQFRDLQGKSLICHVLCLASAYLCLAFVQLTGKYMNQNLCVASAFLIQFFFVACFLWLNVLAFDVYMNIRRNIGVSSRQSMTEKRRFILYSLYSWNGAFILLIVSMVMDLQPEIPDYHIKPKFGVNYCWFNSDKAALPYFYGPIGILIGINVIFFILSAILIVKARKESAQRALIRQSQTSQLSRQKSVSPRIYLKAAKQCFALFIIMGVNWLAEIISWAAGGPDIIWLTTDLFNTCQGILIFYIFVIRPRAVRRRVNKNLQGFWKRIGCKCLMKADVNGGTTTEEEDEDEMVHATIPMKNRITVREAGNSL